MFLNDPTKLARFLMLSGYTVRDTTTALRKQFPALSYDDCRDRAQAAAEFTEAAERELDDAILAQRHAAIAAEHDLSLSMHPPEAP